MSSIFVLGPSMTVTEPEPGGPQPEALVGRRKVDFGDPPTAVGGTVNLVFLPPADPADVPPINLYAFYVSPVAAVPPAENRTAEWFFEDHNAVTKASGSIPVLVAPGDTDPVQIKVPGVRPGAHHLQVIYEFPG